MNKIIITTLCFLAISIYSQENRKDTYTIPNYSERNGFVLQNIQVNLSLDNRQKVKNNGPDGMEYSYSVSGVIKTTFSVKGYNYNGKTYSDALQCAGSTEYLYGVASGEINLRVTLTNGEVFEKRIGKYRSAVNDFKFSELQNLKKPYDLSNISIKEAKIVDARDSRIESTISRCSDSKSSKSNSNSQSQENNKPKSQNNDKQNSEQNEDESLLSNESKEYAKNGTQLPKETIYQKRQREAEEKQSRKEHERKKREQEANIFLKNQKAYSDAKVAGYKQLENDLNGLIDNMFNSWATERDFNNRRASYTTITATNPTTILREYKINVKNIHNLYAEKGLEREGKTRAMLNYATNVSNNSTEATILSGVAIFSGILGQSRDIKEENDALARLRREKEDKLNEIARKFAEKYKSVSKHYLQKAKFAVNSENEKYYIKQYNYYNCLVNNARNIIDDNASCNKPDKKTINSTNKNLTAQDYYNLFLRKLSNSNKEVKDNAEYFLELAISKQPNNADWLIQKLRFVNTPREQFLILTKCKNLNDKYTNFYNSFVKNQKVLKQKFKKQVFETAYKKASTTYVNATIVHKQENWNEVNTLYPILGKVKGKVLYGYYNLEGENIIFHKYKLATHFSDGLAQVQEESGDIYFINFKGEKVFEVKQGYILPFNDGIALKVIEKTDKGYIYGFINKNNKYIIDPVYIENIRHYEFNNITFSEGLLPVKHKNEKYYKFINKNGEVVIEGKFQKAKKFSEGFSAVKVKGRWGFIDKSGYFVMQPSLKEEPSPSKNGLSTVSVGYKKKIINIKDGVVFKEKYLNVGVPSKEGLIPVEYKRYKWGYVDTKGKLVIKTDHIFAFSFSDGLAAVKDKTGNGNWGTYGFINEQGDLVIDYEYMSASDFSEGLASVRKYIDKGNGKWAFLDGFINTKGETVIDFIYKSSTSFLDGKALVQHGDEIYFINKKGERIPTF